MSGFHFDSNRNERLICDCREVGNRGDHHHRPDWHRDRNCCSNHRPRRHCGCPFHRRRRRRRFEVFVREFD